MRRARTSPRVVLAVAIAVGSAVLSGCTSSSEAAPEAATGAGDVADTRVEGAGTSRDDMASGSMSHEGVSSWDSGAKCAMHMPGELLEPHEAVVVFDREHVCLAYVTVTDDTPVMWRNTDTVDHRVVVRDDDDTVVRTIDVPAGELATTPGLDVSGFYQFGLSAIDEFTGVIEVQ